MYESSDHFTGSIPFVGMRVSVSKDDLKAISGGTSVGVPRAPDAYPMAEASGKVKAQ